MSRVSAFRRGAGTSAAVKVAMVVVMAAFSCTEPFHHRGPGHAEKARSLSRGFVLCSLVCLTCKENYTEPVGPDGPLTKSSRRGKGDSCVLMHLVFPHPNNIVGISKRNLVDVTWYGDVVMERSASYTGPCDPSPDDQDNASVFLIASDTVN